MLKLPKITIYHFDVCKIFSVISLYLILYVCLLNVGRKNGGGRPALSIPNTATQIELKIKSPLLVGYKT